MNERYAVFIWGSYALGLAVIAWNVFAPMLRRAEIRRMLMQSDEETDQE